jgi:endonuclease/exonuclease/phosphatase family metal-dependent hydrolase
MRRFALALWLLAIACKRTGPVHVEDASTPDEGVLDTGVDVAGPIAGEVSIATWNLEQFPKTATTARVVREIVLSLAPDLIGVQEIAEPSLFTAFADELEGYRGVQVDDPRNFLRNGLLYREDRVQLGDVDALFGDDGYAFPRPALKADVTVTSTAGELFDFVLIVVHHKAQVDTESRERRRAANVKIDAWIRAQMESTDEQDYVVLGDFNDRIDDREGENVFEVFLDQPQTYFFLTSPLAANGDASYIPFTGLIDHLLVTTDALYEYGDGTTEVLYLDRTVGGYQALISDHRPVLARFKIHVMR